jgi:two-component system nitrogen regulation sensor histidine kinase GlnL
MAALPDAVIGFSPDLRICFSNDAAQRFFGLGDRQLREKALPALLGDGPRAVAEAVGTAIRNNQTVTLHDVSLGGRLAGSVVIAVAEPGAWYMLVIRQQAPQPASEWNEKTKYSLQSAQLLARMLAHEVKNPLAGIRGAAQLLEKGEIAEEDRELVTLIAREAVRIQDLVEKFNIFDDDVPQTQYKRVNLHEVLSRVTQIARAEFGADIEIAEDFDPSLPDARGHFDHLVQAQLNLVKNAAEAFAGGKGRIVLRTYYDTAAGYHPERPEKLPLCVEIEDNGAGITPEALGRIFQPYYTTKAEGQGLGLPIVSRIVDNHGGVIHVDSGPGRTVFRISLPQARG